MQSLSCRGLISGYVFCQKGQFLYQTSAHYCVVGVQIKHQCFAVVNFLFDERAYKTVQLLLVRWATHLQRPLVTKALHFVCGHLDLVRLIVATKPISDEKQQRAGKQKTNQRISN